MFYRQVSFHQGLPFEVRIPNEETIEAMRELEEGKDLRRYNSFDAYRQELGLQCASDYPLQALRA